jgi:endonuclease/exonuclease/phosphatase (EEP) superfamily protein YafD
LNLHHVERQPSLAVAVRRFSRAPRAAWHHLARVSLCAVLLLHGCITITAEPRALLERSDGAIAVQTLACARVVTEGLARRTIVAASGLDGAGIRLLTWNVHKQRDAGWQQDLQRFALDHDIVLLQEAVLDGQLERIIGATGARWVMASSFFYAETDTGVMTASRVEPVANCTQRVVEPLLRLPKSAIVSWFPLKGESTMLAVVNVHAINFSLSLGAYRAQFAAIVDALAAHEGPIVLAGDLNTWTAARAAVVTEAAARLGLAEIVFADDRRRVFFGHQLDHIFTRGLDVVESSATEVASSDHNPVAATLRLAGAPRPR